MNTTDEGVSDLNAEYDILGELGRGGSAIVYHGRDRGLGREVAIKVVRPRHASGDDDSLQRLAREARTVAGLQHPNIVTVYAVKRLSDGGLALVMQLVPGRTLKETITTKGAFPPAIAERVIRDVASALAYAHAHGVVHRDVKPENIFLDAATGRAMLSDFGIAHSSEFDSRLTMTGTAIGTPAYMSPEQIDGKPADPRSDVYSLGLVAWEMLTGERPWEGETLYNVIYKQKHDELPAIDSMSSGVPLRLQYLVERMLQKRPAARWAGADGLLGFMNASVLPADWGQWQDAHRKRRAREKANASAVATAPGFLTAALATIRFRRPIAGDASTTSGADAARAAGVVDAGSPSTAGHADHSQHTPRSDAAAATTSAARRAAAASADADDASDDTPSWAREAPVGNRVSRRLIAAGAFVLVAAGGAFAVARQDSTNAGDTGALPSDVATISVPVGITPPVDNADSINRRRADSIAESERESLEVTADELRDTSDVPVVTSSDGKLGLPSTPPAEPASPQAALPASSRGATSPPPRTGTSSTSPPPAPTSSAAASAARPPATGPTGAASRISAGSSPVAPSSSRPSAPPTTPARIEPAPVAPVLPGRSSPGSSVGTVGSAGSASGSDDASGEEGALSSAIVRATDDRGVIAAGGRHSCVIEGGRARCWGANDRGQLGDGDLESRATPDDVLGDASFVSLATGVTHSCGLTRGGEAFCWGSNDFGQLGDSRSSARSAPGRVGGGHSFRMLRTGRAHTCGVTTSGLVGCWGANESGQLGDNSTSNRALPVLLDARVRFISVTAGWKHSCGLATDGSAYCWGDNSNGQLGDGTRSRRTAPVPVSGGMRFTSIAAGMTHTCAVSESGEAYCWGQNNYGQLGTGNGTDRITPGRVETSARFASVSTGSAHSCGRTRSGVAFCWGRNVYGQLGDGTNSDRTTPVRVAGVAAFANINATGAHSCGVSTEGDTYCWGYNNDGQLGDGSRNHRARPLRITTPQ
ncbi:MAG: protein kinase [Gemmatimonadota bacterium]